MDRYDFMNLALLEAEKCAETKDVPVGAVIVKDGKVIATGRNLKEKDNLGILHAEIVAITNANKALNSTNLSGCELYVTLEPCPMCAGAIIQSRIKNVYFGAYDYKAGCAGTKTNLFLPGMFNHDVFAEGGHSEEKCVALLQNFFKKLRQRKNKDTSI